MPNFFLAYCDFPRVEPEFKKRCSENDGKCVLIKPGHISIQNQKKKNHKKRTSPGGESNTRSQDYNGNLQSRALASLATERCSERKCSLFIHISQGYNNRGFGLRIMQLLASQIYAKIFLNSYCERKLRNGSCI